MLRLQDIMTRHVLSVSPELTIRDAMELLATKHLSGAPVIAGSRVLGIVSSSDLMALAAELARTPSDCVRGDDDSESDFGENIEDVPIQYFVDLFESETDATPGSRDTPDATWSALSEHTVMEAMTAAPVHQLPPAASLDEAARLMSGARVHRLLVVDEGELVGIVTTTDIVRAVADSEAL